jgi:hypothetical protein
MGMLIAVLAVVFIFALWKAWDIHRGNEAPEFDDRDNWWK